MDLEKKFGWLRGRTLKTLGRGEPFKVVSVTNQTIVVRPESTGKDRPISRREIESAWSELQTAHELLLTDIREHRHSIVSPVYVAAILKTIPGVTSTPDPVVLHYDKETGQGE